MKQPLSEQFRKMQKLAGIITESYADYYNEQEKYFEELEAAVNSGRATPEESKMYDEWVKAREEGGGASAPGGVHEATVGYDGGDWEVVSKYPNMLEAIEGVIEYLRSNPEMFMNWMTGDGLPALKQYGLTTPVIHLAGPGETPGTQPPMVVAMDELD